MNKSKEFLPFPVNQATPQALNRLKDRVSEEEPEVISESELANLEESQETSAVFQSELKYDGYHTIEEYDNDAYNSLDLERNDDSTKELKIEGREADPDLGEENLVDPQENQK